jgi:hypothetical protein
MRKRNLPVYMENYFREALENGAVLEIECIAPISHVSNNVRGEWLFFVRETLNGQVVRSALCSRRKTEPRVIKTAQGVASLAANLGATVVSIPYVEGKVVVCEVEFPEAEAKPSED